MLLRVRTSASHTSSLSLIRLFPSLYASSTR